MEPYQPNIDTVNEIEPADTPTFCTLKNVSTVLQCIYNNNTCDSKIP